MTQLALEAQDDALVRVEQHADTDWKAAATTAVYRAARNLSTLTTDDVWDLIPATVTTHEPRALGAIMTKAARAGWIRLADKRPVKSKRVSRHAGPMSVWESLI